MQLHACADLTSEAQAVMVTLPFLTAAGSWLLAMKELSLYRMGGPYSASGNGLAILHTQPSVSKGWAVTATKCDSKTGTAAACGNQHAPVIPKHVRPAHPCPSLDLLGLQDKPACPH